MAKTINGTKKADTITVNASNVIVVTGKKSSTEKISKNGKNRIYGAAGKDTFNIKGGKRNYIYGDRGNDTITVTSKIGFGNKIYGDDAKGKVSGNDMFNINTGKKNYFYGGKGTDTFNINGGTANYISGGAGKDTYIFGKKKATAIIKDYSAGQDMLKVNSGTITSTTLKGKDITFKAGNASVTVVGAATKTISLKDKRGSYTVSNTEIKLGKNFTGKMDAGKYLSTVTRIDGRNAIKSVDIIGNKKDNIIYAGKFGGAISGGSGNNTFIIDSGKGGKYNIFGYNSDTIINGGSNNTIYYENSGWNDTITINGGSNNTIFDCSDWEKIITINGGSNNTINGNGFGNNTFVLGKKGGNVTIKNFTANLEIEAPEGEAYTENHDTEDYDTLKILGGTITSPMISGKDLIFKVGNANVTLTNTVGKTIGLEDKRGSYTASQRTIKLGKDFTGTMDANKYLSTVISIDGRDTTNTVNIIGNSNNNIIYASKFGGTIQGGNGDDDLNSYDYSYGDIYAKDTVLIGGKGKDVFHCNFGNIIINDYTEEDTVSTNRIFNTKIENNNVIFTVGFLNEDDKEEHAGTVTLKNAVGKDIKFGEFFDFAFCKDYLTVSDTSIIAGKNFYMDDINANAYFSTIVTIDARAGEEVGTIIGNDQDNIIYAAGGGNYGGKLYGGDGDDKLYGVGGSFGSFEELYGDYGNDTFVFTSTFTGYTTIMDYQVGEDIIAFKDNVSISYGSADGDDVQLGLSTGGSIYITGAAGKQIAFDLNNNGNITYQTFSDTDW